MNQEKLVVDTEKTRLKEIKSALNRAKEHGLEAQVVDSFIMYYDQHPTLTTSVIWEAALIENGIN